MNEIKASKVTTTYETLDPSDILPAAAEQILFQPSPLQQTLKAQFWARFQPGPFDDKQNITLPTIQEVVTDPRIRKYWALPGFKEWFSNQDENRERLEYLWMVGLDTAEGILRDPAAQPNAKVQLLKLLAEVTGRLTKGGKTEDRFSDDAVNKMSETELKDWLKKKGVTVSAKYSVKPRAEEETF